MNESYKIYKDSVHGQITLDKILIKIIDTPEFQRLRHLKQLETLSYIYPCAVHTRFEHSIGTSHLAKNLIEHLQKFQPELNITDKEVICVQIAALCHDLGHGPFSHLFETLIQRIHLKKYPKATKEETLNFFRHERASMLIFDRIFDKLKESQEFKAADLGDQAKDLIKEMIHPARIKEIYKLHKSKANMPKKKFEQQLKSKVDEFEQILGISIEKSFLFEIVSNFRNGIDVDKWDYFARDSKNLGNQSTFDYVRYVFTIRVINPDNTLNQICAREKELRNVYEMFRTREDLYKRAYQHPSVVGIKHMMIDALQELDEVFGYYEIVKNLEKNLDLYLDLDDRIVYLTKGICQKFFDKKISDKLERSNKIIQQIENRKLYKVLKRKYVSKEFSKSNSTTQVTNKLIENLKLDKNDIEIIEFVVNYGNGDKDPLESLEFYEKRSFTIVDKDDILAYQSPMKPNVFEEITWNLYVKNENLDENDLKKLGEMFEELCGELTVTSEDESTKKKSKKRKKQF